MTASSPARKARKRTKAQEEAFLQQMQNAEFRYQLRASLVEQLRQLDLLEQALADHANVEFIKAQSEVILASER
jgi:hypothetical protein